MDFIKTVGGIATLILLIVSLIMMADGYGHTYNGYQCKSKCNGGSFALANDGTCICIDVKITKTLTVIEEK